MDIPTIWRAVERYHSRHLLPLDAALDAALERSRTAGLPPIQVAPGEGKLLYLLAQSIGATRILEIGTLGGYSTIWLARALPPTGRVVTLEISAEHAAIARANVDGAGIGERVEIRVAPALASLAELAHGGDAPFDLTFIDADKASSLAYFKAALQLSRVGSLIVVDNVVRDGAVAVASEPSADVLGVRALFEWLSTAGGVEATALQTVGEKGYDGMLLARVTALPESRG